LENHEKINIALRGLAEGKRRNLCDRRMWFIKIGETVEKTSVVKHIEATAT